MSLYTFLKFLHIVFAIVAIGFNVSYGLWLRRAATEPEHAAHILRGIKFLDDRFATPAYVLLLVTGLWMVFVGDIPFSTFWIATGLGLYVVLVVGAMFFYTPALRRQTALAEGGRSDSDEYRALSKRGTSIGIALVVLVFVIEFLMVTKPTM
jgi:uncharacterized membrane protein